MIPDDGDLIRNNLVLNSLLHAPTPCGKVKQIAQNECAAFTCACASELESCLLAGAQTLSPVMKYPTRSRLSLRWWESLCSPYLRINKRSHFCAWEPLGSRKVKMKKIKSRGVLVQNVGDHWVGFFLSSWQLKNNPGQLKFIGLLIWFRSRKKKSQFRGPIRIKRPTHIASVRDTFMLWSYVRSRGSPKLLDLENPWNPQGWTSTE